MKIGMRTIKTAISVMLCVIIAKIFKMEYPFYASIAAIISMQSTVIDTFKTGKNRVLGTLVGAGIGLCCALINPGNPFLCFIGIVIVISICNALKWNKSISISGIVFCVIMLNLNGRNPYSYSLNRIIDTVVGIVVAILVNYFISPPRHYNKIREESRALQIEVNRLINDTEISTEDIAHIKKRVAKLQNSKDIYVAEFKVNKKHKHKVVDIEKLLELSDLLIIHIGALDVIKNEKKSESFDFVHKYHDDKIKELVEKIKLVEV